MRILGLLCANVRLAQTLVLPFAASLLLASPQSRLGNLFKGGSSKQEAGPSALPDPLPKPTEAFIVPSSIKLVATKSNCFRPSKNADCKGSAWHPEIEFRLVGPLKSSSRVYVEYEFAGKPWFKVAFDGRYDVQPDQVEVFDSRKQELPDSVPQKHVGQVKFRIVANDPLAGKTQTLYTGSFNAQKHHVGNDDPAFKDDYDWYVQYDWALPLGYLEFEVANPEWPSLRARFWFRDGYKDNNDYSAHVFFMGKEIDNCSGGQEDWSVSSTSDEKQVKFGWSMRGFHFDRLLAHYRPTGGATKANFFELGKNPGTYEIKIIRGGELVRTASFRILPNGRLDTALNQENALRGTWIVIPTKVLGNSDGTWDRNAYQTDLYWGNPLKSFRIEP